MLYAVLVAFVVVVVWEQFDVAQTATESEASAISDLLRDSTGLPAAARPVVQQSLLSYTKDVVDDEFPRMGRGEELEQQSTELSEIWQSYAQVQPVTQSEIAFYRESVARLDDLGTARKNRITGTNSEIPVELWILLLGGGAVMLVFTYLFATPDFWVHAGLIALAAALLGFLLYLIFAFEHPFVGSLSVPARALRSCHRCLVAFRTPLKTRGARRHFRSFPCDPYPGSGAPVSASPGIFGGPPVVRHADQRICGSAASSVRQVVGRIFARFRQWRFDPHHCSYGVRCGGLLLGRVVRGRSGRVWCRRG